MIYNSQKGFSPEATWIHFLLLRHGTLDNVHPPTVNNVCIFATFTLAVIYIERYKRKKVQVSIVFCV